MADGNTGLGFASVTRNASTMSAFQAELELFRYDALFAGVVESNPILALGTMR